MTVPAKPVPFRMIALTALSMVMTSCSDGHLRGSVSPSPDGLTYLAIDDDDGGLCGPILVDGVGWQHPIGAPARVEPGVHTIECGGQLSFEIPAGVVFRFNYWGP
jgi:hypothetical protein